MEETGFYVALFCFVCLFVCDGWTDFDKCWNEIMNVFNYCQDAFSRFLLITVCFSSFLACAFLVSSFPASFPKDPYWSEKKNLFINNINHKCTNNNLLWAFMWMRGSIVTGVCVLTQHARLSYFTSLIWWFSEWNNIFNEKTIQDEILSIRNGFVHENWWLPGGWVGVVW